MDVESVERQDKYDVPADFVLPDLTDVQPACATETTNQLVEATSFDTALGHLGRAGITLHKRRGGADSGWRLMLPHGRAHAEIHVDSHATAVPRELSTLLLGMRGGQPLIATVKTSTTRISHSLLDADGALLAVVSDDRLTSAVLSAAELAEWREVEVEISPGAGADIRTTLDRLLRDAHATPAAGPSNLVGASGQKPARRRRLAGLVDDYFEIQFDAIAHGDLGLRRDLDVIHSSRVAVRRVRSTLRIFAAVFDKACSEELEGELSWFAGLLGQVRDRDVLGSRLAADLAALPSQFVLSTVPAQVESVVSAERETAASALRSAMNGRRYAALVTLLEQWRVEPPYTTGASRRRKTAASYVAAAEKQLRRRLRAAAKPGADDDQFHRARKAGKRLRYAAELAAPVLGTSAAVTIKGAQTWQNRLGELQDSVMAAHLLTRLGTTPNNLPSQDGFAYGLLLAQEWERAEAIRASIRRSIG